MIANKHPSPVIYAVMILPENIELAEAVRVPELESIRDRYLLQAHG